MSGFKLSITGENDAEIQTMGASLRPDLRDPSLGEVDVFCKVNLSNQDANVTYDADVLGFVLATTE